MGKQGRTDGRGRQAATEVDAVPAAARLPARLKPEGSEAPDHPHQVTPQLF
jgi:hypothetical protein